LTHNKSFHQQVFTRN